MYRAIFFALAVFSAATCQAVVLERVNYSFNAGGIPYQTGSTYELRLNVFDSNNTFAEWTQSGLRPNEPHIGYTSPDYGATFTAPAAVRDAIAAILTGNGGTVHTEERLVNNPNFGPIGNYNSDNTTQRFVPSFGPNFQGYAITDIQNTITSFISVHVGSSGTTLSASISGYYDVLGVQIPEPATLPMLLTAAGVIQMRRRSATNARS